MKVIFCGVCYFCDFNFQLQYSTIPASSGRERCRRIRSGKWTGTWKKNRRFSFSSPIIRYFGLQRLNNSWLTVINFESWHCDTLRANHSVPIFLRFMVECLLHVYYDASVFLSTFMFYVRWKSAVQFWNCKLTSCVKGFLSKTHLDLHNAFFKVTKHTTVNWIWI